MSEVKCEVFFLEVKIENPKQLHFKFIFLLIFLTGPKLVKKLINVKIHCSISNSLSLVLS
jgi:hypothetical protein